MRRRSLICEARIAAEQVMLGNEQAKLTVLSQMSEAEQGRAGAGSPVRRSLAGHG